MKSDAPEKAKGSLFDRKGYEIEILFSKGIGSFAVDENGGPRKLGARIDYLGAAEPSSDAEKCPGDRYFMSRFTSPFRHEKDGYVMFGPVFDQDDNIWGDYWNAFMLKDPAVRKTGLKLVLYVPEKLSKIGTVLTVKAEGTVILEKKLTESGRIEEVINMEDAGLGMEEYLEEAHRQQKILLTEWIRFCEAHSIEYRLICGGALGAWRDGAPVPWDDDTDVCVTREGFEKMKKLAGEWDGADFMLARPEDISEDVFFDFMTRLVYTKEELPSSLFDRVRGMTDCGAEDHAVLDIYILENGFDLALLHWLQTAALSALYGAAMGHRAHFDESDYQGSSLERKLVWVKRMMRIGKKIPLGRIRGAYERVSRLKKSPGKYTFFSNGYIGCLSWRFERRWFEKGRKAMLGDMEVIIPGMIEEYLRRQYGNFEELPHAWSRRPGHYKHTDR